jgi:hypothetical protein
MQRSGFADRTFTQLGLRPIWPFWAKLPHTSIFRCITPDALHQLHKGLFKDHLFKWAILTAGKSLINQRFGYMPHHVGLRHFKAGPSNLNQTTGRENREMEKSFLSALPGCSPPLIRTSRNLLDFIYTSHFTSLSESQLQSLETYLLAFHQHKASFVGFTGAKLGFNGIPKLHMPFHYVSTIRFLGTPDGFSTEAPERYHIDYAKDAYRASNRVNYFPQMVKWLTRQDSIRLWTAYMEWMKLPPNRDPALSLECSDEDFDEFGSSNQAETTESHAQSSHAISSPPLSQLTPESPLVLNNSYPRPLHILAKRPTYHHMSLEWVRESLRLDPVAFVNAINTFIANATPNLPAYLHCTQTEHLDFWIQLRLVHPSDSLPTLDHPAVDTVLARPAKIGNGQSSVPESYSTALQLVNRKARGIQRKSCLHFDAARWIKSLTSHV